MSLHIFQRYSFSRRFLLAVAAKRAVSTIDHFEAYLQSGETIIDIGCGICDITQLLRQKNHTVTALDIDNFSCVETIEPTLYDGKSMPFGDKTFDTALILTVLHHTPNPEQVLSEAARIAKRIIIIEDVHTGPIHKYATFAMDSLLNLEFFGHPHSNKTDQEWQALFAKNHLRLVGTKSMGSFGVLRHKMYVLKADN